MTAEEQKTRELKQCGMTYEELDAEAERWGGDHSRLKLALSYLSDAQEALAITDRRQTAAEEACQRINCAKYLIDQEIVLGSK